LQNKQSQEVNGILFPISEEMEAKANITNLHIIGELSKLQMWLHKNLEEMMNLIKFHEEG
jgi:hypothetical protein